MEIKNKRTLLLLITYTVLLYWGLNHLGMFMGIIKRLLEVVFPFLVGGAIAFVLNAPMKNIEKMIAPALSENKAVLRAVSILLSFLLAPVSYTHLTLPTIRLVESWPLW